MAAVSMQVRIMLVMSSSPYGRIKHGRRLEWDRSPKQPDSRLTQPQTKDKNVLIKRLKRFTGSLNGNLDAE